MGRGWSVKAGRFEMIYGDQRLVGGFEWHNQARSFDAAKLIYKGDSFDLDIWTSKELP